MRASPALLVTVLTLLLGLQPLSTDLYLPALPALTATFGGSMTQAQLTLSALLLAFGASQLIWGPVSDRVGRRPILILGLALYTLSAIGSSFSFSMESLIMWRVLQGVAMGGAIMAARALVRDLFDEPVLAAKVMSQGLSGLGVIACISTPIGGLLTDVFGWRVALLFLALVGSVTLGLVLLRVEETLRQPKPDALQPRVLWRTWKDILSNHTFWSFALLQSATYAGLFIFLATSSFVFIEILALSSFQYGMLMFTMSASYIGGTLLCRRLLLRLSVQRTAVIGGIFALVGGSSMGVLALLGYQGVWYIMLPLYIYMIGHGINQPCAQSGAMGPFPRAAGAATALSSFIMVLFAFAIGHWLGLTMDGTVLPTTLGIWASGVAVAIIAWSLVARVRLAAPA
ncbi:multidrug effflux MFS transporter [Salinispirillum sp. LH 10-3-1]|uniref:Bcr/CflA family efflux transporter n=1 Tax=Salinispirillum sp. LH 10-3-1 TaxID=2952525 RepID=A0AB38YJ39_9GAMM